jgi:hypothetical protein
MVHTTNTDPGFAADRIRGRLYVGSGQDAEGRFEVVDAGSGVELVEQPLTERWLGTLPAYFRWIVLSPDGRWAYVLGFQSIRPEQDAHFIRVFDTRSGSFLDEELPLPCLGTLLLPADGELVVACTHEGLVLTTPVDQQGHFGRTASTRVSESGIAGAARLPGSSGVLVLTRTGRVARLDANGLTPLFGLAGDAAEHLVDHGMEVSPDGLTAYVGLDGVSRGRIMRLEAYDVSTGERRAAINLPLEAWTFSVGASGERLYAAVREEQRVLILDAADLAVLTDLQVPGSAVMVDGP